MESLRPLHKASFPDVLDYGISLFKKHFKKLFLINLMFNIPIMVLLAVINPMFTDQYWNFVRYGDVMTNPSEMFSSILTLYAMVFGVLGLNGLFNLTLKNVMEGSMIKLLYSDVALKQERTLKQVIRESFGQFWTMLLGRLLYILIESAVIFVLYLIVIAVVFGGTFGAMGIAATSAAAPWLTVLLTILGILVALGIVFFISAVVGYFSGRYWMFLPAICIEQQKAGSSIGRCGNLGKNSFFLISLTYITGGILTGMFPGIINLIFSAVSMASGNMDVGIFQLGAVITQIFTAVLQPLFTCILTALYITLRVRREGLDIELNLWAVKKEELNRQQRWMPEASNASE